MILKSEENSVVCYISLGWIMLELTELTHKTIKIKSWIFWFLKHYCDVNRTEIDRNQTKSSLHSQFHEKEQNYRAPGAIPGA